MCNLYSVTTNQAAIIALFREIKLLRRERAAVARRVSRLSCSRDPQHRRENRAGDDALGPAATATRRRAAGHQRPQHVVATLAYVAETAEPLSRPANSFAEYAPEPNPETKKKDAIWFALNEGPPAVRVRRHLDDIQRQPWTKSKPIPGPHQVYGFLTTEANAVVKPIRAKAMPVILATTGNATFGCARLGMRRRRCFVR
jgi:putative SOS response-associated peptidase YedK